MTDGVVSDLIFDIGLHRGNDATFYLKKGFKVVGLEAVPGLCEFVKTQNLDAVSSGRLTIIQKALSDLEGQTVEFFVNPSKDDWGSLTRGVAEKGMGNAEAITVETTTLESMMETFGVPYYLKCDIEGADAILVDQLLHSTGRPSFVSIEATSADDITKLSACGYDRFQIVNQYMHPYVKCPVPAGKEPTWIPSSLMSRADCSALNYHLIVGRHLLTQWHCSRIGMDCAHGTKTWRLDGSTCMFAGRLHWRRSRGLA